MLRFALTVITAVSLGVAGATGAYAQSSSAQAKKQAAAKAPAKKAPVQKAVAKKSTGNKKAVAKSGLDKREKLVKKTTVVKGRTKTNYRRVSARQSVPVVPAVVTVGELAGLNLTHDPMALRSNVALVLDQASSQVLFEKNADVALPIASVTKLMTALVVVEAGLDNNEILTITDDDIDREKHTGSRLRLGARLTRDDMLHIALMSSENRAASALGRHYPGGLPAFVNAMNAKAKLLGMKNTHYVDSTGLSRHNVSSAHDLAKLVVGAYQHELIRNYSTDSKYSVDAIGRQLEYGSSNRLIRNGAGNDWEIGLQKTGFINEAGHCLVMQTKIDNRPIIMVFLDSKGKLSPVGDANRLRKWIADGDQTKHVHEEAPVAPVAAVKAPAPQTLTNARGIRMEPVVNPAIEAEVKHKWLSGLEANTAPSLKKSVTTTQSNVEG
jgi:D-alanyl-D-alanine endopeptidase (penicillin-binding protein 7)